MSKVRIAALLLLAIPIACIRTAPPPANAYWVSSDSSEYSPSVRLRVVTARDGATFTVMLDSGTVGVPGPANTDAPVTMRNLYVTAYIAAPNTTPIGLVRDTRAAFADRRGWRAIAASDSALVADQLRFGEQRPVHGVRLQLRDVPTASVSNWVVLGISGEFVDLRLRVDERVGGLRVGDPGIRNVQVYACSNRNLAGQLDTARSNGLQRAYGLMC